MSTRNTGILREIVAALGENVISPVGAKGQLERRFKDQLLIVAGDVETVARYAEQLRLAITPAESTAVLDYIAGKAPAGITIDHVEAAINDLFPDRFIEP